MKKLRLTSFCLAFVMVVALMVPALSVLATAASVVPGSAPTAGMPATLPTEKAPEAALVGNTNVPLPTYPEAMLHAPALRGAEYTQQSIGSFAATTTASAGDLHKTAVTDVVKADGSLAGLLLRVTVDAAAAAGNNAMSFGFKSGEKYFYASMYGAHLVDNSLMVYAYGTDNGIALSPDNDWWYYRGTNNRDTARLPKGFDGYVYVPLNMIREIITYNDQCFYGGANNEGHANLKTADAAALIASLSANGISEIELCSVWDAKNITLSNAYYVYVEGYNAVQTPTAVPSTLPTYGTYQYHHAGWNDAKTNGDKPQGLVIDPALVGKSFTMSENLISASLTPDTVSLNRTQGDEHYVGTSNVASIKPNANLAGIMLKVSIDGAGNNNGLTFGFGSGSKLYSAADNPVSGMGGSYLYSSVAATNVNAGQWYFYTDPGTHSAARVPGGFDGYVYLPLNLFKLSNTKNDEIHRAGVTEGTNATADLLANGINYIEIGRSWGDANVRPTVSEVRYVYVNGYDPIGHDNVLPGSDILSLINIGASYANQKQQDGSTKLVLGANTGGQHMAHISNPLSEALRGLEYTTVSVGTPASVALDGMDASTRVDLTNIAAPTNGVVGLMLNVQAPVNSSNSGTVIALTVDGTVYYALSYQSKMNVYLRSNNSSQWYTTSNSYTISNAFTDGPQRVFRLPAQFNGELFIPLESFHSIWDGAVNTYNAKNGGTKLATEGVLTAEILANAESISLTAAGIWTTSTVFGEVSFVYPDTAITAAAPVLGEDITLKVQSNIAWNTNNVTLDVDFAENETVVLDGVQGTDNAFYFEFEDIKAQNMTDNIAMTLKVDGKVVDVIENYSIKAYADKLLASDASAEAKALVAAMLQYGAAAQMVAGYKVNDLAAELKDFSATEPDGDVSGKVSVKVSAFLDKDINLTITGLKGTVTATIGDRTIAVITPVDGTVKLEGILANELDETITLYVDGDVVKTLSVNAYLAVVVANNTGDVVVLAKALYEYGVAAAAYAN